MYRHRRHRSKVRAATGAGLLAVIGIAAGLWMAYSRVNSSETVVNDVETTSRSETSQFGTDLASQPETNGHVRWVFGHSIVPGGIHSIEELAALVRQDPTLAEHYQNFSLSKGRVVTLDHDVLAFVSYRLDGAIYWQKRPTLIARGEQVLTDGSNSIRARCGNRIVEFPQFPTSPAEPTDMDIVVGKLTEPPEVATGPPEEPAIPTQVEVSPTPWQMEPTPTPIPIWFVAPPVVVTPPPSPPIPLPPSPYPPVPPSPPFGADEFSQVTLTILGHSRSIPTGALTLLAGIALVTVVRLVLWRSQ